MFDQNASGDSDFGKRHPMPMMAMGAALPVLFSFFASGAFME
jgi:hypothetical protein